MNITYAVSLPTKKWSAETRQLCNNKVQAWLDRQFPADRLPANVRIRVRQSPEDEVYRAEISEKFKNTGAGRTTTITIAPHRGQLVFDVRMRHSAAKDSIVPRRPAEVPPKALLQLCVDIAQLLEVYDAERRVAPAVRVIATNDDGQALGADSLDALSRRLPIIIEYTAGKTMGTSITAQLAQDLVGIAHIAHVTTPLALQAFNSYCGTKILNEQYITIVWPQPVQPTVLATSQPKTEQIASLVIDAATMQPDLPIQAPPHASVSRQSPAPVSAKTVTGVDVESLKQTIDLLHAQIDEKQFHIDQLDELLAESDEQNDALVDDLEERESQLDELTADNTRLRENIDAIILDKLDLEAELSRKHPGDVPRTVLDAVHKASNECRNLVFLKSAFETAAALQGPDPNRLLKDLRKLDQVVQDWKSNRFSSSAGLGSFMRDEYNLDFVPNISSDTAHRHATYYTAVYDGKPVLIGAHLRRGKNLSLIRVYMYVDNARKTIVVGKIDRHGPDQTN